MTNINYITISDKSYPKSLDCLTDKPPKLWYIGNLGLLNDEAPKLAVVGSRRVTSYGKQCTLHLVTEVCRAGVVVVSGLALGVDALGHQACLDAKQPTIAVMAGGLDQIYPATNRGLAEQILKRNGLIISEFEPGTEYFAYNFVARNRIVSGLSNAVFIPEAAEKSGTLHTARFALEQGKTVLAVPGPITSPLSAGTNNLIKAGATPVTTSKDILQALHIEETPRQIELLGDTPDQMAILVLIQNGITDGAQLLQESSLTASNFNQALTMLEIQGSIRALGANQWSLR